MAIITITNLTRKLKMKTKKDIEIQYRMNNLIHKLIMSARFELFFKEKSTTMNESLKRAGEIIMINNFSRIYELMFKYNQVKQQLPIDHFIHNTMFKNISLNWDVIKEHHAIKEFGDQLSIEYLHSLCTRSIYFQKEEL